MINYNNAPLETTIEVRELFENPERKFELVLLAGEKGLNRKIKDPHIQKLGLVLAGEFHYLDPHRIQIFGKKEITYLTSLKKEVQVEILEGVGVLILGKSGIGKSECALDLIIRGHRLVSDDVVKIIQTEPTTLFGTSFNLIQNLMEIRGLGIINIRDLFGVEAIRKRKKIDLIVELVDWLSIEKPERLGLDQNTIKLLDVEMPFIQIPVTPGRNLTTIIEVAARNHILRASGTHTPQELEENLLKKMREENSG